MFNTKIENCNYELLQQQKQELIDEIVHGNNQEYFKVFDLEAGTGKTRAAEQAFAKMVIETNRNAIFVRLTNKDCRESAENINNIVGKNVASAFNNEDISIDERYDVQESLYHYRVICITHSKYLALENDKSSRKDFVKGRNILVIDEFLADIKSLKISIKDINNYKILFADDAILLEKYINIIKEIEDYLMAHEKDVVREFVKFEERGIKKAVSDFKKLLRSNLTDDVLRIKAKRIIDTADVDFMSDIKTVNGLCKSMENILQFYNRTCLYANMTLYTTDLRYEKWLLNNNIILDASGDLQTVYELDENLYHLSNIEPVLDHCNWTIYNIIANSTSSGKERIINFYEIVNRIASKNDDTLVICKKEELSFIENEYKTYFGNLIGSNDFRNLKNVVVAHTPNLNDVDYILRYLHYNKEIADDNVLAGKSVGHGCTRRWEFTNKRFENIRTKWIASEIYQAIKRVNRNMQHDTNCFLICNNIDAVQLVAQKLKNCMVKTIDDVEFDFVYTKHEAHNNEQKENGHAGKFIKLLAELQDGQHPELLCGNRTYKKKILREYLKIKSAKDFNNKVLSKTDVIQYCRTRGINILGQYVKFLG